MFDPRTDIISLFTSSRIGAASRYSTTSVYVKILKEEVDNTETEPNDYGDKYVGILWLKQPRAYLNNVTIGTGTIDHEVVVDCHLIIPRNDHWLKNIHETYINNILNRLESTLESNSTSSASKSWDVAEPPNILSASDPDNPNICFRVIELVCRKTD